MSWRPSWWLDALKIYWPLNHKLAKATNLPVVGKWLTILSRPLFGPKYFNITYIPVNENVPMVTSTVLSQTIIAELIHRSAHRVVIKRCSCRDSKGCKNFPIEDACMLLGADTGQISPQIAKHITIEEALAHMNAKIASGLIPMTGRVRMDDLYYGVPNRKRMLTICFCCPCCCTILNSVKYFPQEFRDSIVRLKGMRINVDHESCKHCKTCVEACFMAAIQLHDERIIHDDSRCIGCGRCATICPHQASVISIDNLDEAINELANRIAERVCVE